MRARLALLRRQPIISIGLVAINVAVFLLCKNFGKLIYMGDQIGRASCRERV